MQQFNSGLLRSIALSATGFSVGATLFISSSWPASADQAKGNISFTADNAAEVFLNGKSLGQTNDWKKPFTFEELELQQGQNVIGIAAWDSEGIAAMSGEFKMPDSTEFGTTNSTEWLVFPADKNPNSSNSAGKSFNKNTEDPLSVYADLLDIPPKWNEVDYTVSDFQGKEWVQPGFVTKPKESGQHYPWANPTGDPVWLWWGENSSTKTTDWWSMNFVLFRYEFTCVESYCNDDVGWDQLNVIDIVSRDWNDIIDYYPEGKTYAVFEGGTLSFANGFDDGKYEPNFLINDIPENTIDNAGKNPVFTGELFGPGGIIFRGKGTTILSGENTYSGLTAVENGILEITNVSGLGSADAGTRVENGAALRITVTGQKSDPGSTDNDAKVNEKITLDGGELDLNGNYIDLRGGVVLHGDSVNSTIRVKDGSTDVFVRQGKVTGEGGLIKEGTGFLRLATPLEYQGQTIINAGELRIAESTTLPRTTDVSVNKEATLRVMGEGNEIQSLNGDGKIHLQQDYSILASGLSNNDDEFSGVIEGKGGFNKVGEGTTRFSGDNIYEGSTTISNGVLQLASQSAIPQNSETFINGSIEGSGRLDLVTNAVEGKQFNINNISISGAGQLSVSAKQPLISKGIKMNANQPDSVRPGGIVTSLTSRNNPPITVASKNPDGSISDSDGFRYESGSLIVAAPKQLDPEGTWQIVKGYVDKPEELAKQTFLIVGGSDSKAIQFEGLDFPVNDASAFYKGYLKEGSLNLVIQQKGRNEISCTLLPGAEECNDGNPIEKPVVLPINPDPEIGNKLPDTDGDGIADKIDQDDDNDGIPDEKDPDDDNDGEIDQLPGCEVGDDMCDIISDIPGNEDDALDQEEEIGGDVIDGIQDGLGDEEIDLPFDFDYGQLAKLVSSGLLPRNVDAPGRSLFNYNNLLVDTVFERLPLRQFRAVEVAEVVEEEAVIVEPAPEVEPIRGLWSKTEGMNEQQAQEYLEQRVAQGDEVIVEDVAIELDGVGYVEDPSLTAQYAERDGVRAWYRAFGGDIGPTQTSILYGDYSASAGGMVLGADVSLGSNVQIGAFANYGDVTLNQFGGDTGSGSWNPNGWGGGITANYWSENFYVQGLISASGFSGNQKRNIVRINDNLGDETASGDKSVTSYAYALRLGAPFQAGNLLMEPQFTAAWTQNQESGFSESGAGQLNLRYGSRTTNFLQTELGMKFALPIRSGERAEWVPNLRVAWLGDWDQNNGDQTIGYRFTDKDVDIPSYEEDNSGVLIEGGIDYTMANINSSSWKLYVRGGAEVWGGDRGTDWRASGGVAWQF